MCVREEVNSEDVEVNITDLQSLKEKQIRELEEEQHRREVTMGIMVSCLDDAVLSCACF